MSNLRLIQEQLERSKTDQEKVLQIKKFYSNAGPLKQQLNSRQRFDKSQIYEVLTDQGGACNGFIEVLPYSNDILILNIGLRANYKNTDILASMLEYLFDNNPTISTHNYLFTFIHVGDSYLEYNLDQVGFRRVVDRPTLNKVKAPLDGLHLTYVFERRATVTNRLPMMSRQNSLPINQPVRTGDRRQDGNFDPLKRLQQLKEKSK